MSRKCSIASVSIGGRGYSAEGRTEWITPPPPPTIPRYWNIHCEMKSAGVVPLDFQPAELQVLFTYPRGSFRFPVDPRRLRPTFEGWLAEASDILPICSNPKCGEPVPMSQDDTTRALYIATDRAGEMPEDLVTDAPMPACTACGTVWGAL